MNLNVTDGLIIALFMVLTIVLGCMNTGVIKNINVFALGRRAPSTFALACTIIATWASGSGFLITLNETYSDGWYYLIPSLCMCLSMFIIAIFITPKMHYFFGSTTVASIMSDIYGKKVRKITALCGALGVAGSIAVQFKVCGNIGHAIFGLEKYYFIIGMGMVIIWYSVIGGIKSVIKTDILQVLVFMVTLPFTAGMIIYAAKHNPAVVEMSSVDKFNLLHVFTTYDDRIIDAILLGLYFAIPSLNPAAIQRISMGESISSAKKAWLYAGLALIVIELFSAVVPYYIYQINPSLKEGEILGYIINNFTVSGFRGLLLVGIIAMAMSTADSYLNISAVLIANDLWKADTLSNESKLYNARRCAVFIGFAAIVLACYNNSLLKIILWTNSFYMPIVTVPLLFGIYEYRTSEKNVLISMGLTFLFVSSCHIANFLNLFKTIDPIIPGMILNAVILLSVGRFLKKEEDLTGGEIIEYEPKPTVRKHTKAKKKTKGLKKAQS